MTEKQPIRLLLFDTNYFFNKRHYTALEAKGVEITRLFDLEDIERSDLATFTGLLAHPGIQFQREFMERIGRYLDLKVAIISDEPGEYRIVQSNLSVLPITDSDAVWNYFSHGSLEK